VQKKTKLSQQKCFNLLMPRRTTILYILLWVAYISFSFTMFPVFEDNVLFLILPVLGIGAWIFGTTVGLLLCMTSISHIFIIYNYLYTDIAENYENRLGGTLLSIALILLAGSLRKTLTVIKSTNRALDLTVEQCKKDLNELAQELIEKSEQTRVAWGEELHDGIGQQLTGIKLYSESIADQLYAEGNPSASVAFSLINRSVNTHNMIRHVARFLFPVRMIDVGLDAALSELADCFQQLNNVNFSVNIIGTTERLSPSIALQTYRLCQEFIMYAFNNGADRFRIEVEKTNTEITVCITHNNTPPDNDEMPTELRLIGYRLQKMRGTSEESITTSDETVVLYHIPVETSP
jgi:signal transduction histidine kinase